MDLSLASHVLDTALDGWFGLFPHPSVAVVAAFGFLLMLGMVVKFVRGD
jgi:nitrate reductase NapE component